MSEPTYVLYWLPPYAAPGTGGLWDLQPFASYEAGEPQPDPDWSLEDEPRDIDAADFTGWIAEKVGYPVTVEPDWTRITCPRALRFRRREPLFWVFPAEVAS